MLFRPTKKNRKFLYQPSFYDEKKDQEAESRKKISFRQNRETMRGKKSWISLFILIILITVLMINLNKMRTKTPDNIELKNMEVVK
jgi:hypothetical protein